MGSGVGKTIWALGLLLLLLLLGAGSARNLWEGGLQAEEVGAPGQGPRPLRDDSCPPPPRTLPPDACQVARCQADTECQHQKRCCYNGCAYACMEVVPPPPAETCSTTEDGAEPLLCPSGYECHILSPGDMAEGIPNRGQCVRQRRQADARLLGHKFYREYPEGASKNVAEHGRGQQRHV